MLPEVSCQPCSEHAATDEVDAQAIADLLKCHLWIVSAQMSGFIADDLWSRLPEAWQAPLLALSDEEASRLPTDLPLPRTCSPEGNRGSETGAAIEDSPAEAAKSERSSHTSCLAASDTGSYQSCSRPRSPRNSRRTS